MAFLLDIADLSDSQTNEALEFICKAAGDGGHGADFIFDEHPSPFILRLVELFYQRGLDRITDFKEEMSKWIEGRQFVLGPLPQRPDGAMSRWTAPEMQLVRIYLTALPPDQFQLDDYMLLIDFLFQRYLPADDIRTEAQWLATRATLMGRVQANMETITSRQADRVLAALPTTVSAAKQMFQMTPLQTAILEYAAAHAAENVQHFSDHMRHRLRRMVLQVEEERIQERPGTIASALQSKLFDEFAALNRDWRRIAVTEAGEAANQGQVSSVAVGTRLKRLEQYRGACPFCRRIDGKVMEVTSPDNPRKDGDTQIWVGKTNVGRSAAPRKRMGADLIEREPHERYWIAAGVQHPHCRGRWLPTVEAPGEDPAFSQWLQVAIGEQRAA